LLAIVAAPGLSAAPAGGEGPISRRGTYEGGRYLIEVPADWNGGLVLYAHGFRGTYDSPLTSHLLDRGYALAASSYRAEGYRVDLFVEDMRALLELFIREVRRPRWTIIHGQSMGGHVAIASLELQPALYHAGDAPRALAQVGAEVEGPAHPGESDRVLDISGSRRFTWVGTIWRMGRPAWSSTTPVGRARLRRGTDIPGRGNPAPESLASRPGAR